MDRKFVGRTSELQALTTAYESPAADFWPIYGRRRIGKTELIKQFLETRPGIYFLGKILAIPCATAH